jgi:hypothetical protein
LLNRTAGYGLVNENKSVYSNDNSITFLLEDEIEPEQVKIFPINFPQYLIDDDLGKKRGILKVTASLCFSFLPVPNHQLAYCPIHMAFCFFKNQNGSQILESEESIKSLLKSTLRWSQSGRHVGKPIPYTNTQKKDFWVNRDELISESSTFKLAINCKINPQLLQGTETQYKKAHAFSLVVTIEETLKEYNLTGKLYNEICLCNTIENISDLSIDNEAIAEAES